MTEFAFEEIAPRRGSRARALGRPRHDRHLPAGAGARPAARGRGVTELVLDLADVSFVDSSGLGLLLATYERSQDATCPMAIVNSRPEIQRVFRMAGVDDVLPDQSLAPCSPPSAALCGLPALAAAMPSRSCASSTVPITWPTTRPSAAMKNVSGQPGHAPVAARLAAVVAHVREREPELVDEVARVLGGVLGVDADEQDAVGRLVAALEHLRLGAARVAPGGPEVDHQRACRAARAATPGRRRRRARQAAPERPGRRRAWPGRRPGGAIGLPARERVVDRAVRRLAGQPVDEQRDEGERRPAARRSARRGAWSVIAAPRCSKRRPKSTKRVRPKRARAVMRSRSTRWVLVSTREPEPYGRPLVHQRQLGGAAALAQQPHRPRVAAPREPRAGPEREPGAVLARRARAAPRADPLALADHDALDAAAGAPASAGRARRRRYSVVAPLPGPLVSRSSSRTPAQPAHRRLGARSSSRRARSLPPVSHVAGRLVA